MGVLKKIERSGKSLLIGLITRVVRTRPLAKEQIVATAPKRIIVIRQHHQMGDMLLAVPAMRALKETFPGVEVAVVAAPINRVVLNNHPYVDRVLTYNNRNPLSVVGLVKEMRRGHYDLSIVLHTMSFSFTSAMLGLLSGATFRVGSTSQPFGNRLSAAFYHLELPLPDPETLKNLNEAEHNLYPLRAIGVDTDDLSPLLVPTRDQETWAEGFFRENALPGTPSIVVHPGAGKLENIWPPEKFAEVVNMIAERTAFTLFVAEGPRDAEPVARFSSAVQSRCVFVRGRSIGEVAALMRLVSLVICNDTGVMHVSCAAGATTLAVFGPTDPVRWAPVCPNLTVVRAENGDLQILTPDTVFARAMDVLDKVTAG